MVVSVTNLQGQNICEQTACLPNPCQNGGVCSLSDAEGRGYECTCKSGYTGITCNEDRDECTEGIYRYSKNKTLCNDDVITSMQILAFLVRV
jgi:hypothetical protein